MGLLSTVVALGQELTYLAGSKASPWTILNLLKT